MIDFGWLFGLLEFRLVGVWGLIGSLGKEVNKLVLGGLVVLKLMIFGFFFWNMVVFIFCVRYMLFFLRVVLDKN